MTLLTNNIRWFLLLVFVLALMAIVAVLNYYQLDTNYILVDAVVDATMLTATVWAGLIWVKSYPTKVGILVYALLIGIAGGVVAWCLDKLVLKWWFVEDELYLNWLRSTYTARLLISVLVNSWLITLAAVNQRTRVLEAQFKNISDAATLHREAELFKLRQQLQPHFLYNSLNSISALILLQPDKAQEMVGKLSDFLRNSVKREAREQIPVDEELQYIEAYLAIEAVRFGDRLKVVYDKEYTDNAAIPPFLLQPVLENAIKFGLYGRSGDVMIRMNIALKDTYLIIIISNPFDPDNRPPSGTGFGLEGIQRRLYLLYGRKDLLETSHNNETFTTILKIPQGYAQNNTDR